MMASIPQQYYDHLHAEIECARAGDLPVVLLAVEGFEKAEEEFSRVSMFSACHTVFEAEGIISSVWRDIEAGTFTGSDPDDGDIRAGT